MAASILLSVDGDISKLTQRLRDVTRDFKLKMAVDDRAILAPLGRIRTGVDQVNSSLDAANQRVITFGASALVLGGIARSFNEIFKSLVQVDKAIRDINSVLNLSSSELNKFSKNLFDSARNASVAFDVAANAAIEFSRQGLGAEETIKRLDAALVLSRLSGLDSAKSVDVLTSAINGFAKENLSAEKILNKLVAVDTRFAVSTADLAEALSRVGSTAQDAGVSFDKLLGIVTSVQQITARGGSVIGNSLKTIFTRIQRTDVLDQLESFGVAVRDASGNALAADKILENLGKSFDGLSKAQQQSASELAAGVYQINQFRAILADLGRDYNFVTAATDASSKATSEAIKRNETLNKSLAALVQNFKTSATEVGSVIGEITLAPLFNSFNSNLFIKSISDAIKGANLENESQTVGNKLAEGVLQGFGNFISGPGIIGVVGILGKVLGRTANVLRDDLVGIIGKGRGSETDALRGINSLLSQASEKDLARLKAVSGIAEKERVILEILNRQNAARNVLVTEQISIAQGIAKNNPVARKQLEKIGKGNVPNFADPLNSAIEREKAAGVNPRDIYVDFDSRLRSASNPLGAMVANRRDEPLGGYQGVNRALSQGINPKTYGMSNSSKSVPNFAEFDQARFVPGGGAETQFNQFFLPKEEQAKLRSLFRALRQEGVNSIDAFKRISGEINAVGQSYKLTSDTLKEVNQKILIAKDKLAANILDEARRRNAEDQAAKDFEKQNLIRAKDFDKARRELPRTVIPKDDFVRPSELTADEKAAQLGFVPPAKGRSLSVENSPEYKEYIRNLEEENKIRSDIAKKAGKQVQNEIFTRGVTAYSDPIGPNIPPPVVIVRQAVSNSGPQQSASNFPLTPEQQANVNAVNAQQAAQARKAAQQFQLQKLLGDPTRAELSLKKQLTGLSDSQLESLLSRQGLNSGTYREGDIGNIRSVLRQKSYDLEGGVNKNVIGQIVGLSQSGTLATDFEKTVKGLIVKGSTLEDAYVKASKDFIASGGNNKQLQRAQLDYVGSLDNFVKDVDEQRNIIAKTASLNNLNRALTGDKGLAGLNKEQRKELANNIRQNVTKELFGNADPALLAQNAQAQNQIRKEVSARIGQIQKDFLEKAADKQAEDYFKQSQTGTFFGDPKGFTRSLITNENKRAETFIANNKNLSKSARDKIIEQGRGLEAQRQGRIQNAALIGSIALPIVGGLADQLISNKEGGSATGIASGAINAGTTGAGIAALGVSLGLINPIVAGVGVGLAAIAGGLSKSQKSLEDFAKSVDEVNSSYSKQLDAANFYIQAQQRINDAITDGASNEQITALVREQFLSLQRVGDPSTRAGLLASGLDVKKAQEATRNLGLEAAQKSSAGQVITALSAGRGSGLLANVGLSNGFDGKTIREASNALVAATDLSNKDIKAAFERFAQTYENSPTEALSEYLGAIGASAKDIPDIVKQLGSTIPELKFISRLFVGEAKNLEVEVNKAKENQKRQETQRSDFSKTINRITSQVDQDLRLFQSNFDSRTKRGRLIGGAGIEFGTGSGADKIIQGSRLASGEASAQGSFNQSVIIKQALRDALGSEGLKSTLSEENVRQITGAQSAGELDKLASKFETGNKELSKIFKEAANSLRANELNTKNALEELKIQTAIDLIRSKSEQKQRVLSGSVFNKDTIEGFFENRLRGEVRGSDITSRANRINSGLTEIDILDQLGLPETAQSTLLKESLKQESNKATFAEFFTKILGSQVDLSTEALNKAADDILGGDFSSRDKTIAERIKKGLEVGGSSPQDELRKAVEQGGFDVNKLLSSGEVSISDAGIIQSLTPLNTISSNTGLTNTLLKQLLENAKIKDNNDEIGKIDTEIALTERRALDARTVPSGLLGLAAKRVQEGQGGRRFFGDAYLRSSSQDFRNNGNQNKGSSDRTRLFETLTKVNADDLPGYLEKLKEGDLTQPLKGINLTLDEINQIIIDELAKYDSELARQIQVRQDIASESKAKVESLRQKKTQLLNKNSPFFQGESFSGANLNNFESFSSVDLPKFGLTNPRITNSLPASRAATSTSRETPGRLSGSAFNRVQASNKLRDSISAQFTAQERGDSRTDQLKLATQTRRNNAEYGALFPESFLGRRAAISAQQDDIRARREDFSITEGQERIQLAEKNIQILDEELQKTKELGASELDILRIKRQLSAENSVIARESQDSLGTFTTTIKDRFDQLKESLSDFSGVASAIFDSFESGASRAFGDFVTGTKSATDAFRSFALGVLNDSARAFGSKAVQGIISASFGAIPGFAEGGMVKMASGGSVPALLMGGEYYLSPDSAKNIGKDTLDRLNQGNVEKYAGGGRVKGGFMVTGGSGYRDDVPARLQPGGYVLKKSAVQKYGRDYIEALGQGKVEKKFWGGVIGALAGAAIGGGIGYAVGGEKGALIGAGIGALGGAFIGAGGFSGSGIGQASSGGASVAGNNAALTGATSATGTTASSIVPGLNTSSSAVGNSAFSSAGNAGFANSTPITSGATSIGDFSNLNAFGGASGTTAAVAKPLGFKGIAFALGASAVLGLGAQALTPKPKNRSNLGPEVKARTEVESADGEYAFFEQNPQGGMSLVGYAQAPATRRFSEGGSVYAQMAPMGIADKAKYFQQDTKSTSEDFPTSKKYFDMMRYDSQIPLSRANGGEILDLKTPEAKYFQQDTKSTNEVKTVQENRPGVNVTITINNNGSVTSQAETEGQGGGGGPFGQDFAMKIDRQVRGIVQDEMNMADRVGGRNSQVRRTR